MRQVFILLFFGFSIGVFAQEENAIKQSISVFFEGLQTSDTLKIQSVCHKEMKLQSITEKNAIGSLSFDSNSEFYKSIAAIPKNVKIEERILSYNIQIDGTMANVCTPYEFYINEKLSHIGVNSFTLLLENNIWKIVHIIDTRRKKI
ncbi:nuclear transport factor 2 family protein [Flavobacterium sp.]|uniref:nuclear transport factor 2 family protein n=1 Tax=Flavobacterium sp. TaxID=239 RepID=UPI00333E4FE8